jgi:hypothetical protein
MAQGPSERPAEATGFLGVSSTPAGLIVIDGTITDQRTPARRIALREGAYLVDVYLEAKDVFIGAQRIVIHTGSNTNAFLGPLRWGSGTGLLTVHSHPSGEVFIDGAATGRKTPLENYAIETGRREVQVRYDGSGVLSPHHAVIVSDYETTPIAAIVDPDADPPPDGFSWSEADTEPPRELSLSVSAEDTVVMASGGEDGGVLFQRFCSTIHAREP